MTIISMEDRDNRDALVRELVGKTPHATIKDWYIKTNTPYLKFIERDGKRILQQIHIIHVNFSGYIWSNDYGQISEKEYSIWFDVPLEEKQ